jgi:hypothetical protein
VEKGTKKYITINLFRPETFASSSVTGLAIPIHGCASGPFLRIFPWGGGAFFEKGPFCEIIY